MGSRGTCLPLPARSARLSTERVWSLARATTSARAEKASLRASHPASVKASSMRLNRRIPSPLLLGMVVLQDGGEGPDQARADRLSAEPAEPERERHCAPHVRLELHRFEGPLQPCEPRRGI